MGYMSAVESVKVCHVWWLQFLKCCTSELARVKACIGKRCLSAESDGRVAQDHASDVPDGRSQRHQYGGGGGQPPGAGDGAGEGDLPQWGK